MKNSFLIVPLSAILFSGVAMAQTSPASHESVPPKPAATKVTKPVPEKVTEKGIADTLPNVPLTRNLLYRLLSADLAYQRGHWKTAYITTLRLAKQTRDPRLARRAAQIAISAKQTTEALAAVRLWHELAPHSEEATKYFLGFVLISDKLVEAKPILVQRLKEATPRVRTVLMFQIQRLLAGVKDKAKAFVLLEELLAPYLGIAEAHIALAQGALNSGNRDRALTEAKMALVLQPDSELAALTIAQASVNVGQAMQGMAAFIAAYPKAREVRLAYARILIKQEKYEQAQKEFEALLDLQPQDGVVLYSLGMLSVQTHDKRRAARYLERYLEALEKQEKREHDPARVRLMLAQLADEQGDANAAMAWLAQIEHTPGSNAIYISAQIKGAEIEAKRGNIGAARRRLAKAETESVGEQVGIILAESQIIRDAGDAQEALTILETAIKRYPENTHLLYDHAMAAEKCKQLPKMEASLRKLIRLEPSNAMAYNALGYSLADRKLRLDEARTLIARALRLKPNDAYIMDSMGWVLFRLGKIKDAEHWLRLAYKKRPEAEIAVHLGEVLWIQGSKEEALKFWRAAEKNEPKNKPLLETLKRLGVSL